MEIDKPIIGFGLGGLRNFEHVLKRDNNDDVSSRKLVKIIQKLCENKKSEVVL